MSVNLYWGKRPFFNTYQICSAYYPVGKLFYKTFSQKAFGELNGKKYAFKTSGFFKPVTRIIDNSTNKTVGSITYSNRMTTAIIEINGKKLNWKFNNWRNSKWQISKSDNILIKYDGSSTGGQIRSNSDDDLLLLSGLFVSNYYWQMSILVVLLSFTTICLSLFHK